jgi:hypothetical protein
LNRFVFKIDINARDSIRKSYELTKYPTKDHFVEPSSFSQYYGIFDPIYSYNSKLFPKFAHKHIHKHIMLDNCQETLNLVLKKGSRFVLSKEEKLKVNSCAEPSQPEIQ